MDLHFSMHTGVSREMIQAKLDYLTDHTNFNFKFYRYCGYHVVDYCPKGKDIETGYRLVTGTKAEILLFLSGISAHIMYLS